MEIVVEFNNLFFKYNKNASYALNGINLKIYKGEIIGYIGPNGAGKTTTIKLLLNLLTDYQGTIKVFDNDIREDKISYKYKIGYVPENAYLYENLTGFQFLDFMGKIYGIPTQILKTKIMLLADLIGISYEINQKISSYSKGMKQKLLIISAFMHNPDIIILDEPLNGLDANCVAVLKKIIMLLANEGKTIFYSSHLMDVVEKISKRIILINSGKIIADGTFEEIKKENSSLEKTFENLTGSDNSEQIALDFIKVLKNEKFPDT